MRHRLSSVRVRHLLLILHDAKRCGEFSVPTIAKIFATIGPEQNRSTMFVSHQRLHKT